MITILGLILFAYLLGSFSTAILVCKWFGLPDPRTIGSGNPGATNVLREAGKRAAVLTLVGDTLKGFFPVWLAKQLSFLYLPELNQVETFYWVAGGVGLAAFLGHLYPIYFQFKGGKGVATAAGVLLGWDLVFGLMVIGAWLVVISIARIASVAALFICLLAPIAALWMAPHYEVPIILMCVLIVWRHRQNIYNLVMGIESKIR